MILQVRSLSSFSHDSVQAGSVVPVAAIRLPSSVGRVPRRNFQRSVVVPHAHLIEVDVVGTQPAKALLDCAQNVLAAQPAPVDACTEPRLGGHHHVAPVTVSQPATEDLLGAAVPVRVSRVDEVAASGNKAFESFVALCLVDFPAERHGAQAEPTHL